MSGRKESRPRRTRSKAARYEPYDRPPLAPGRSPTARLTGVPTDLVGLLLGEEEEQETVQLPPARSLEAETFIESELSTQDSKNIDERPNEYDALPGETTKGVPRPNDLELWTEPAAEFIRSEVGLTESPHHWIGKRPLGEGGFGLAGLWERLGVDGTTVDEVCVKQIGCDRRGDWDPKMPKEVEIMYHMNETDCPGVIEIRGYKRYPHESIHRIFMEYCPHGDLRRLYKRYRRFRQYLPEAFLWEVFHYQVEAASAMANGPADGRWVFEEIVHRDIKPGNVFLAIPNPAENPFYPVAKLGDWGLAIETSISDKKNPRRYTGAGTPNYMAPEQVHSRTKAWYLDGPSGRLSSYTNIWAIGATMYDLLTLHHVNKALYLEGIDEYGEGLDPIETQKEPDYTHTLRHLVRSCLRPNPADRPDIRHLQKVIESARSEFKLEGSSLRGEDQSIPHESERLYFHGKDIENMKTGLWEPTYPDLREGDESGFRDPRYSAVKFPEWNKVRKTDDEGGDKSSSGDGETASRRVLAGYTGDGAQVAGPAGGDQDEGETGSLGGEPASEAPEQPEYQEPVRNAWDRNTWDRLDEATISETEMQRLRKR